MIFRPSALLASSAAALTLAACGAPEPQGKVEPAPAAAPSTPGLFTAEQIDQATAPVAAAPVAAAPVPATADGASPTPPSSPGPAQPQAAEGAPATPQPDAALIRAQVLLDRADFSPGVIDGLNGTNLRQAIAAYREAKGLPAGDGVDAGLIQSLAATDAASATTRYTLTPADVAGPFSPPPSPDNLEAQAAVGVHYSSPIERIAERFHVSEALLTALNPGADFARAGTSLIVPAIDFTPLTAVARIEVDKASNSVRAYDEADQLVAFYPATIGSGDNPSPSGDLRVEGVARNPDYTHDPAKLSFGGNRKVVIPPGPNGPVGVVWIDLNRPSYGIHGTLDPSKIGKTASHGCVRLTNWDAWRLAAAVKPGVEVRFH